MDTTTAAWCIARDKGGPPAPVCARRKCRVASSRALSTCVWGRMWLSAVCRWQVVATLSTCLVALVSDASNLRLVVAQAQARC
jgi:hypothetical protein